MYVTGKDVSPEGALCSACTLRDCPYVEGYGPDTADIVIVGEAPGDTEVRRGEPFVGRAGQLLDAALRDAGINRADCYLTNTCMCRPQPHRAPNKKEIECCKDRLIAEVKVRQPKVVLALGNAALKALTGRSGISNWRGAVLQSNELNANVVPAYHPAAILRSMRLYPVLVQDIKKAVTIVNGQFTISRTVTNVEFMVPTTVDQISNILLDLNKIVRRNRHISIDVETASDGSLLCIGLSWMPGRAVVIPAKLLDIYSVVTTLDDIFSRSALIGHNLKYDLQVLWRNGFTNAYTGADTMLEHYVMNETPGTHGLKQLAREFLNAPEYDEPVKPYYGKGFENCPSEILYRYNAYDAAYTYMLHETFQKMLDADNRRVLDNLLYPASDILARMESLGVMVDIPLLKNLQVEYSKDIENILTELYKAAGRKFNPNSPKQLIQLLYTDLELPIPGRISTDEDALNEIKEYHPIVDLLLQYRAKKKISSTYVDALLDAADENDRVHTTFNLHGTVTGRLSSSHPVNLQNIPKDDNIRNIFIATPGYTLVEGDLKQAEVRGLAYYSQDKNLIDAITSGTDMHIRTACLMFRTKPENVTKDMRQAAKRLTFGVIYQMSAKSLAHELNISIVEAEDLIERFFAAYPQAREWIAEVQRIALETGKVMTPFGRVRRFGYVSDDNKGDVLRQAVNAPIQSLASDVTLTALIKAGKHLGDNYSTRLLLTVHDSILLETREDPVEVAGWLHGIMSAPVLDGRVPFDADVKMGKAWGSLEEFKEAA